MPNVLIVEDNVDLANVIRSMLEFESHSVDMTHNGDEGLSKILSKPYDLIILDWDLPNVSGLEILKAFRATRANTPVIMLTGKDSIDDKEVGLDGGADDYITKPFNLKELGARIRAHLRRAASPSSEILHLGDIRIDIQNRRATKGARTYALSSNEIDLLALAAKYPHIRPTSRELLDEIWKNDLEKPEQKLRMIMRRLRKKLDPTRSIIFPHLYIDDATNRNSASSEAAEDTESDPFVGTIFNEKYEMVELIGGGGSGLVYIAKHLTLNIPVAIKILHMTFAAQSDTERRFHREARLMAELSHINIVCVRDFGISEIGPPYIVMELLEGGSLSDIVETGKQLPIKLLVDIFMQVTTALEFAHANGLVHRDIKPSNVVLTKSNKGDVVVKLIDFGMARSIAIETNHANITQTGEVLGSPPYMSPEQCRGEPVDSRSDIYSLGCALYEAATGRLPFSGDNPVEILVKHVMQSAPEPDLSKSGMTLSMQTDLKAILDKCLEKNPADRYQSAVELRQDLEKFASAHL